MVSSFLAKAVLYSACLSLSSACLSLSSFMRCAMISSFTAKAALSALMLWLCAIPLGLRAVYVFRALSEAEREKSERL